MLKIGSDNSVYLTRGDTAYLQVPIYNDETGEEYVMEAGDKLVLSVKKRLKDTEVCFSKANIGTNIFHILPSDTCDCTFSAYVYDVELTTSAGDVYTVIEPTTFEIGPEVT